jgi:hypothetical protein
MGISQRPLLTDAFLRSIWAAEYEAFQDSDAEAALRQRLERWVGRRDLGETASEAAFIDTFFVQTWGYHASGQSDASAFTYRQQFPIAGSGQDGGTGRADLALGFFTGDDRGRLFLAKDEAILRELDAFEGLPKLLSLVAERPRVIRPRSARLRSRRRKVS